MSIFNHFLIANAHEQKKWEPGNPNVASLLGNSLLTSLETSSAAAPLERASMLRVRQCMQFAIFIFLNHPGSSFGAGLYPCACILVSQGI